MAKSPSGQVIGLIEAMKLFNEIKSDVAGRVLRVAAESGALVKAKQTAHRGGAAVTYAAHLTGWGAYAPSQVLTNHDLEQMVDTSDEWIVKRTGIRERRVAAPGETTASMGAVAGLRAIAVAGLEPDDIDVILLATLTPDYWMPSTAALVKEAIGNTHGLRDGRHGGLLGLRLRVCHRPGLHHERDGAATSS